MERGVDFLNMFMGDCWLGFRGDDPSWPRFDQCQRFDWSLRLIKNRWCHTLMVHNGLALILHRYAVSAKCCAKSFKVIYQISDHFYVPFQQIQQHVILLVTQFVTHDHGISLVWPQKFIFQSFGQWLKITSGICGSSCLISLISSNLSPSKLSSCGSSCFC
jgi:hypothetical protein